ncbi:MAG: iron-containing alcohol dehydrogenase [Syntrophales bacterium]|nr:iron-containing alcohol dehydrogenase [Syntrophales bacterium]
MQNFVFHNPTRILFGKGMIERVGEEVKRLGQRVFFVFGQGSIKRTGTYEKVVQSLKDAGVEIIEFSGVRSNPLLSHAVNGIKLCREERADVVLAVGGGSVIDTAKTIAAGVRMDPQEDIWDYFTLKKRIKDALPVVAVVTVSASSSESNPHAVMTKDEGAQKLTLTSPFIQPRVSILDPTVLFTLPSNYTAYSSVDIIAHLLEGYFNNQEPESVLQDRLVEGLMKTVMESTEVVLKDPEHYNGRANIMWSAVLAFSGITTAGLGIISFPAHMVEHSLSALYDVPHGAGLSITLPAWMKYALRNNPSKFARLAREVMGVDIADDLKAAEEGIRLLKDWFARIGSPVTLREVRIPEGDMEKIAEHASFTASVWRMKGYTKEVILEILELCKG